MKILLQVNGDLKSAVKAYKQSPNERPDLYNATVELFDVTDVRMSFANGFILSEVSVSVTDIDRKPLADDLGLTWVSLPLQIFSDVKPLKVRGESSYEIELDVEHNPKQDDLHSFPMLGTAQVRENGSVRMYQLSEKGLRPIMISSATKISNSYLQLSNEDKVEWSSRWDGRATIGLDLHLLEALYNSIKGNVNNGIIVMEIDVYRAHTESPNAIIVKIPNTNFAVKESSDKGFSNIGILMPMKIAGISPESRAKTANYLENRTKIRSAKVQK